MNPRFKKGDWVRTGGTAETAKVIQVVSTPRFMGVGETHTYFIENKQGKMSFINEQYLVLVVGLVKPPITPPEGPILDSPPDTKGTPA